MFACSGCVLRQRQVKSSRNEYRRLRPGERRINAKIASAATRSNSELGHSFDESGKRMPRGHIAKHPGRRGHRRLAHSSDCEHRHLSPRDRVIGTEVAAAAPRGDPAFGDPFNISRPKRCRTDISKFSSGRYVEQAKGSSQKDGGLRSGYGRIGAEIKGIGRAPRSYPGLEDPFYESKGKVIGGDICECWDSRGPDPEQRYACVAGIGFEFEVGDF